MNDSPTNSAPGRWRGMYDWLFRGTSAPGPAAPAAGAAPSRIAHYAVGRKLGEGGMGVVYSARDERLQRTVALKVMSVSARDRDETARQRFWREARAAASVNHPNICQIYEIAEDAGTLFIAMELLEGESLADRLQRGAIGVSQTIPIGLTILAALSALHQRGIVHRDLKPSNVFLTPHGVKLLDFGLARPSFEETLAAGAGLTQTGAVLGTPRYMSPEQVNGGIVDARSDLFAVGAMLFEMLAGRPAFTGRTLVEVLHATLHEQPAALTGSPGVAAVDRVIRRALAKRPDERPPSAEAMAAALRSIPLGESDETAALVHPMTRLVVLPFRVLRADPETDFLAYSLPDAISTSLSGIRSLVVRSSATAARFAGDAPDLKAVAAQADVDRVVMGTVLRSGDELRVAAQLVDAPSGTLVTSHTFQSSMGNLFQLQDDIAKRIFDALSLPLSGATPSPSPERPRDPQAYEWYLRANELARTYDGLLKARELYEQCLERDPSLAAAWAHMGRCMRVIAKFVQPMPDSEQRAEDAFRRALALNPRLAVAHKFYAFLEADLGRAEAGMVRLLHEAARHGNDPELFAGLVQTCRYCGLYEQSIAAHFEARRLDPNVPTSYEQSLLLSGDLEGLLTAPAPWQFAGAAGIRVIGAGMLGRRDEARHMLDDMRKVARLEAFSRWADYLTAWLEGRAETLRTGFNAGALKIADDPEAIFLQGWLLCDVGDDESGLDRLTRAVDCGYFVAPTLARSPQFARLRGDARFQALLARAEEGRTRALAAFRDAGGTRLLGS